MEREPDLIFEAICEVCGIEWTADIITANERGRVNAARKELVDLYGDIVTLPMMIHERGAAYKQVYPDMPLTPQALTGNWGSILALAETAREQAKQKQLDQRKVTNAHAKSGCQTCGDDHIVSVGWDSNGYEQTAPCPDCNLNTDATYWADRRKIEPMDAGKTREYMG